MQNPFFFLVSLTAILLSGKDVSTAWLSVSRSPPIVDTPFPRPIVLLCLRWLYSFIYFTSHHSPFLSSLLSFSVINFAVVLILPILLFMVAPLSVYRLTSFLSHLHCFDRFDSRTDMHSTVPTFHKRTNKEQIFLNKNQPILCLASWRLMLWVEMVIWLKRVQRCGIKRRPSQPHKWRYWFNSCHHLCWIHYYYRRRWAFFDPLWVARCACVFNGSCYISFSLIISPFEHRQPFRNIKCVPHFFPSSTLILFGMMSSCIVLCEWKTRRDEG